MIRILHSVSNMDRGGIETMLMNYYRHIDRSKVQFDFVCNKQKPGAYDEEIQTLGGRLFHSPGLHPLRYFQYINFFKKLVHQHPEYKVLEVHNGALGVYALNSGKRAGIPVRIYHAHGQGLNMDYKIVLKWMCKKLLRFNMNHHFTCGLKAGEYYFGKQVMNRGDYVFVHNAIDVDRFVYNEALRNSLRKEYGLENAHIVGHVGRFMHQKNHTFLIDVFAEIAMHDDKAVLVLLGDGELQNKMKAKAEHLGIGDRIRMMGNVGNANEWYQAFDLFILPSHWEGLPVVGVEAQAAGLPCLFSSSITSEIKMTGNAQFLDLKSGVKHWAEVSLTLLRQVQVRNNMREAIALKGYDIRVEAKKLEDLYLKMYNNAKSIR